MDPVLTVVASTLLAVLLASSGLHKLQGVSTFRKVLAGYRLLPAGLLAPVSLALPVAELGAALCLLIEPARFAGALCAIVLFGLYAGAITLNLLRGLRDIACGCAWDMQGSEGHLSKELVVRNLALIILSAATLAGATRETLLVDRLDGLGGGIALAILCAAVAQLRLNHRSIQLRRPT